MGDNSDNKPIAVMQRAEVCSTADQHVSSLPSSTSCLLSIDACTACLAAVPQQTAMEHSMMHAGHARGDHGASTHHTLHHTVDPLLTCRRDSDCCESQVEPSSRTCACDAPNGSLMDQDAQTCTRNDQVPCAVQCSTGRLVVSSSRQAHVSFACEWASSL
jgi:hypothetical protein